MYLHSLELVGFKSFASKTVLNFHPGVTAIVGPNGCGKSNVLDAMRWVLGEQSAKALRGGEMSDVIFSGTDARPALGMAEVSLTFAECEKELGVDYNEVRITRRVFRDGASEYLLNKTPCRLRDIHNLFMDTGIGRSAYSIMEQGKIDLILSSKPEDRRAIFEEAAGITKFKSQRREALRKLEATEANLLRVTDVIREVKRQIGSLQRQAGKARRYQVLLADLRTLETHHARQQFETHEAARHETEAEIERLREVQANHESEIENQESEIAGRRRQLEGLEAALNAARQAVQDLKNHIANAENRIGFNTERITEFATLMDRYGRDIAAAQEKLSVQQTQIENTDLELEQISDTLRGEQERFDEKMREVNALSAQRVDRENAVKEAFGSIAKLESRLHSLRGEISSLVNLRDGSETRMGILQGEIEMLAGTAARLAQQHDEVSAEVLQATNVLHSQQEQAQQAETQTQTVSAEVAEIDKILAAENRSLAEKGSRLEVLRQLNESGQGFAEGTQAVLRGLDNRDFFKPSILGALAAHIVVEPKFIPAIEAALGQNLQTIVMKDKAVAESVLKTLAAKKLGRASLALREFFPAPENISAELPEGAIAWAADRVKADSEVEPLVFHLLRGVLIVENLEDAFRLRAHGFHLVTLAGERFSRDGILSGGATGEAGASMLERKNQITSLATEVEALEKSIAGKVAERIKVCEELEAGKARLEAVREEMQKLTLRVSTLCGQLEAIERETRETAGKSENLQRERQNIENRHSEAVDHLSGRESELAQAAASLEELQSRQASLQTELDGLRAKESVRSAEMNDLRIKVATEKQRYASLNNQRQPMAARLQELRDLVEQRMDEIKNYREKSETLAAESARIKQEIESTRAKSAEADLRVGTLIAERSGFASEIESLDATLRILRRQLTECHDQRGQREVKQTQLQLRLENLSAHIMRRYQIELHEFKADHYALHCTLREQSKRARQSAETAEADAQSISENENEPPEEVRIDWEKIEAIVAEMNQRLDAMGPINLDAIQEYDELEQRHTFLEQQFTDLTNSKNELLDVIAKINSTTKKMFAETFEQVRVNFKEMFLEIFGGGHANLLLLDESDPLESGIDIIAKPPGKQLQSISLLSGGEKTMTAVALLFSIYMVKPSPFCVLDEMDAPLDESNINRFIKILDRFVSQSQFVVISHNKRTIAKADALYGVTMEEHGISKLVGVRFAKREESIGSSDIIGTANFSPVLSLAESFGKTGNLHSEHAVG